MKRIRNTFASAFQGKEIQLIKGSQMRLRLSISIMLMLMTGYELAAQSNSYQLGPIPNSVTSQSNADCQTQYTYSIPEAAESWTYPGGTKIAGGAVTAGANPGDNFIVIRWDQGGTSRYVEATYYTQDPNDPEPSNIEFVQARINITVDLPDPGTLDTVAPICYNTTPTITSATLPGPTGTTPTYIWQHSVGTVTGSEHPSAISWETINQQGAFTEDYTPPGPLTASRYYRRRATLCNTAVYTDPVFVEVYPDLNPGTISVNFSCNNATATLSATDATGGNNTVPYTYTWQKRASGTNDPWSTASTSINSLTGPTVFRRRVSSSGCNDTKYSNEVTVNPEDLILTKSLDLTQEAFCYGDQPFVKLANSQTDVEYELYLNASPTGDKKTGTGSTLTWNVNTAGDYTVMAISNTACGPLPMTGTAEIVKYTQLNPGTISVSFDCNNATASLSGTAASGGNTTAPYTYVWQSKPSVGGSWGTTSTTITSLSGPTLFRRKVSSATCNESLQSLPTLPIEIRPEDLVQTQSLNLSQVKFCAAEQPVVRLAGSQLNVDYELYRNGNPTGSIEAGTGSALTWNVTTTADYTVKAVNHTSCSPIPMTGTAQVVIWSPLNPGIVSVNFDCNNATASLTGTAASGGNTSAPYTYVWQSKPSVGGNWTTTSTSITNLSGPTLFRRLVSSATCNESLQSLPTLPIEIKPEDLIQAQSLDLAQEVFCFEEQPIVKLADSQQDVDYELYLNASPTGNIETGTGSALTWNVSATGDYTIMAVNNTACGSLPMTGTARIKVGLPNVYDVTGGGAICPGITSDISLSGSDIGAKYYLKLGSNILLSTEKDGNGYPLEWCSIDVAGSYTIVAKQGTCNYRNMNNLSSPVVEIGTPETPSVSGNYTTTLNGSVTLSTQAETGVTYRWYNLNGQSLGTGSSLSLSNMDSIIELVVVADNGGCSTSVKITAGYAVVQSPTVAPQLTSACGHYYLQKSGSPAANHTWYWQGKNAEGKEQLIDAELYDYRVATSGTYYLRSFNELAGIWADLPLSINVNLSDPATIKPTSCSNITAMQVAAEPGDYTSGTYNYIRTYDVFEKTDQQLTETAAENAVLTETNNSKVQQATQYIDGLGRPLQTVSRKASPDSKDMIQPITYDAYGRPTRQYLPYTAQNATGALREDPFGDQKEFYQGGTSITAHFPNEQVLYGETLMEKSPLNRAKLSSAPGDAWTGNRLGTMADWRINTAAEGIRRWTIASNPQTTAAYAPGELYVTVTTDENGNQVKEYANAKGQVVLKQVQSVDEGLAGHDDWFNTYYIYNTYNQLAFVLPPRAVELLEANNWNWANANLAELIFSYAYDSRNRMISKQVPGSGRVDMVYDKLDRLVATQDANQRAINQWTFTKYDALSRPVMTGFVTIASTRAQLQSTTTGWTNDLHVKREGLNTSNVLEGATITTSVRDESIATYRAKNTGYVDYLPGFTSENSAEFSTDLVSSLSHEYTFYEGYHDATFPLLSSNSWEMNTVNFYDDYDFTSKSWSNDYQDFYAEGSVNALDPVQHPDATGMATGSKVRILDTDDWLTSVMFYDNRGRVVQTQGENHLGGTDISTTQYDFAGRVLHTYTIHNNPDAEVRTTTRILKRFAYDHAGRLLSVQQKINDFGNLKTLVANTYNALGELETKTLGDNLESLDYDYNIRGWLKSINGDYVDGSTNTNFFGMDLSYETGFEQNQLNGNIAGVTWRSKSSSKTRAYGFDYDNTNRLLMADYHQNDGASNAWSQATADFSTSYGYDANGNILKLLREGVVAGTITTLDSLSYNYGSGYTKSSDGNRLLQVKDKYGDLGQGDFKDGNTSGNDYGYDANGNMAWDKNKGIYLNQIEDAIDYNHLNLPVKVSFGSNKTITYTYDAAGIKLSKLVDDNGSLTTTDYVAGFIYEGNKLQHFAHEEGRVRTNENSELRYDYFIKDHLGNTRMTLTETTENTIYEATMETNMATFEEQVFLNVAQTRSTDEYFQGAASAKLGPESIGPAKMLVVNTGDQVDLSVYVKYPSSFVSTSSGDETNIGMALAGLFGATGGGATVYEQGVYNNLNNNAGNFLASALNTGTSTVPKAYLNYIFFDQDFNLIMSESGSVPVDAGASGAFDILEANGLTIDQAGYLYVYVSNEGRTADGGNVYFDALRIDHTKGHILQEDHYYPFGLTINALSSSAPLSKPNKFKYNGKEEQTEFNLNWYDYGARNYDAQIGKWFNVDPLANQMTRHSPYNYAFDNPIMFIDPDGMKPTNGGSGGARGRRSRRSGGNSLRMWKTLNSARLTLRQPDGFIVYSTREGARFDITKTHAFNNSLRTGRGAGSQTGTTSASSGTKENPDNTHTFGSRRGQTVKAVMNLLDGAKVIKEKEAFIESGAYFKSLGSDYFVDDEKTTANLQGLQNDWEKEVREIAFGDLSQEEFVEIAGTNEYYTKLYGAQIQAGPSPLALVKAKIADTKDKKTTSRRKDRSIIEPGSW